MTTLAVVGVCVAVAFVGWLFLCWVDNIVDYARTYRDPFATTLDEIRQLPEKPELFDQEVA